MDIIRQEIPIKSFVVSAYICKKDASGGKFLLIKRASEYLHDSWQQVSGKVEPGELGWEAALREIKEETCIVPDRFYSADFIERFYEPNQNIINLVPVFVGFADEDTVVQLSEEHSDYLWVTSDEAYEYLHFSQQRESITHIQNVFLDNEPSEFLRISWDD